MPAHLWRCPEMKALCCATTALLGLLGLCSQPASANDGRDRYQVGYPNLFVHLEGPVGAKAGFRTLSEATSADGFSTRWAWTARCCPP